MPRVQIPFGALCVAAGVAFVAVGLWYARQPSRPPTPNERRVQMGI